MSRLIDQLRASNFPGRSTRDLTLEYGRWLEGQQRDDVFLANPDFAQEYTSIKDELARATRPGLGEEFKGAFGAAVDDLQASGYALGALAAEGARNIGVPGAEPVRNNLLRLMKEQEAEAAEYRPSVGSYRDINSDHALDDTLRYATYGLGTVGPSLVQSVTAGLIGAAAGTTAGPGGTIGGALLGLAEKKLAQKAVSKLLERGVTGVALEQVAKTLPREAVAAEARRLAIQYGAQGALAASSIASEVGSIYGDNPEAPGLALAYGIPAGLLDIIPESLIAGKFLGAGRAVTREAASDAVGYFRRFATEAAKNVPLESSTEAAQTLLEIAAGKHARGESPTSFTEQDWTQAVNAGIIGAIAALPMAGVSATARPDLRPDMGTQLGDSLATQVQGIGELSPMTAGPADFGPGIPDGLGDFTGLGRDTMGALDAGNAALGRQSFAPEESAAYGLGAAAQPQIALPPAVQRAIDGVDLAIANMAEREDVATAREFPEFDATLPPLTDDEQIQASAAALEAEPQVTPAEQSAQVFFNEAERTQQELQSPVAAQMLADRLRAEQAASPAAIAAEPKVPLLAPSSLSAAATETAQTPVGSDILPQANPAPVAAATSSVSQPMDAMPEAATNSAPISTPLVVTPSPKTAPTGEQLIARGGNGVPMIPPVAAPNLRRLQVFEQPVAAPVVEGQEAEPASIRPVESQAVGPNPQVELAKRVGKLPKDKSNVVVVLVDNANGQAYQRGAYGGPSNTVYIDMASRRKGTATGQGSTVSYEADFLNGTEGREARRVLAERLPNGQPRFTLYGIGELKQPGKLRNWNLGAASGLNAHPGLQEAAKRGWTEQAERTRVVQQMPSAKTDIEAFPQEMAAWRRDHPGKQNGDAMLRRIEEFAEEQNRQHDNMLSDVQLDAWVNSLYTGIQKTSDIQQKFNVLLSADYLVPTASTLDLFRSTLRALVEGRQVDVVALENGFLGAADQAAQATGLVMSPDGRRKIVAFGLGAINGPVNNDTVLSLLHETAHVVTDGLPEPLRVAFQEAVEDMPWQQARWLMNPRSLDIRILANADPATLSPEQRAVLMRLSPEEMAQARRIDRTALLEEQMVEHLAQLGFDKSEAKGLVDRLIRFVKDLWLRLSVAVQQALKGQGQISPELARRFAENRFLQFIHRDAAFASDRLNDLLNWLGVPATERQRIPVFPAGKDWDQRMQFVDVATGQLIPVDHATYTPDAQTIYLKTALDNAARWVRENPAGGQDTPDIRLTRRVTFSAPLSFTPSVTVNTQLASLNLEAQIYAQIAANPEIAPLLPRVGGQAPDANAFAAEWLRVPSEQLPSSRKAAAVQWATQTPDPLTGQPVAHQPDTTVDQLPVFSEQATDREGRPIVNQISQAQDVALKQTILALRDTQRRLAAKIARDTERVTILERQKAREKDNFGSQAQGELSTLSEELVTRTRAALVLDTEINRLLAKFRPGDVVNVFPGAELLSVPANDATEEQIRSNKKFRVPSYSNLSDAQTKEAVAAQLAAMEAWLLNSENVGSGQIYGIIAEQFRKLNQLPVGLERAGTAAILRRSITGGFVDELRASGLPSVVALGKKFAGVTAFINAYQADVSIQGRRWSAAFREFADTLGRPPDQAFVEQVWDPLMRVWNFIDSGERNALGTPGEENVFAQMERALKSTAGVEVKGEKQRAALRGLLMQTIEAERYYRQIFEQHPELKVFDRELGTYRRLITHGLVTGRRLLTREVNALMQRMTPMWSDTTANPSFWESAATMYGADRAAFDQRMTALFGDYVLPDFVEPLVTNNQQLFRVTGSDGLARQASLLNVREAWRDAQAAGGQPGEIVTRFAEVLHRLEGGMPETTAQTVGLVLADFRSKFEQVKSILDKRAASDSAGQETLARQMLDGREADDLPAAWVSYATYTTEDNLTLLHQLAMNASFGPDALAAKGEVIQTIHEAHRELTDLYDRFDRMVRDGRTQKEIEVAMGKDDYTIARNADKIADNLDRVEAVFKQLQSVTNYLSGDFRALNETLGLFSTLMLQNPRSAALNISDILGPLSTLKLSRPALKALKNQIVTLASELGNSVLEAFGQNAAFNTAAAKRRLAAGAKDTEAYTTWRQRAYDTGSRARLTQPTGYEGVLARAGRTITRLARQGRSVAPNIGSPVQGPAEPLAPKLRLGLFQTVTLGAMNANIDAAYTVFSDLAQRGVDYLDKIPLREREQFVRELELGVQDLGAEQLGYYGGLVLNDAAAFDSMKFALQTQFAGERGVGAFVAKAYRRREAASGQAWDILSPSQFTDVVNYANSQWSLQGNFATLPPWMQNGPFRPLFIFLTWPYLAMRRFGRGFTDAQGRLVFWGANSTVRDGLMAFFVLAAPATVAGSFAIDFYDKYLLGKKQNLRETDWTTALPVVGALSDPAAFVERIGRYGSAGFASDILNQVINYDSQRNLSLDSRIVAINAIGSLFSSLVTTPIQQEGNLTYNTTFRPFFQAIGGGGVLQYLQVGNNLLGLNNQEAAINARINTGNWLRAAGRELDLPVRVFTGPQGVPTPITPYLSQMELAALVNNPELFREAYRNAVQAARDEEKPDPERYVAENFVERHPLKRLFKGVVTESDYRKMLGAMGDFGAAQVRSSVNSFNRYMGTYFDKRPYYGKADRGGDSVEELIRKASRINETVPAGVGGIP